MSIGKHLWHGALAAGLLAAAGAAWADCKCDDGTVFRGGNGECKDGSICHLIDVPEVKPFNAEPVAPAAQQGGAQPNNAARKDAAPRDSKVASFCASAAKFTAEEFMYRCDDGSIREDNDCPDGSFGHLFSPKSITCKKHDAKRPNRIALPEFLGNWQTWVPGSVIITEDRVNNERRTRISRGTAAARDLAINANGTYVWKGIRGTWRETGDDENPIILYKGVDGHDWQVSILENWYGYLAVSDARNPGVYYYGKR